jgi:hypothetical protein
VRWVGGRGEGNVRAIYTSWKKSNYIYDTRWGIVVSYYSYNGYNSYNSYIISVIVNS